MTPFVIHVELTDRETAEIFSRALGKPGGFQYFPMPRGPTDTDGKRTAEERLRATGELLPDPDRRRDRNVHSCSAEDAQQGQGFVEGNQQHGSAPCRLSSVRCS